jgi:hypothetical protein
MLTTAAPAAAPSAAAASAFLTAESSLEASTPKDAATTMAASLADIELEPTSPLSVVSNALYTDKDLAFLSTRLEHGSESCLSATLLAIRSRILDQGREHQSQMAESGLLGKIVHLCIVSESTAVQEASCRLICSIAARNNKTTNMLIVTPVISRFVAFILAGQAHQDIPCPSPIAESGTCGCGIVAVASAAMWALNAACVVSKPLQASLATVPVLLSAILAHLASKSEDAQSSAAFLLRNIAVDAPSAVLKLMDAGVSEPLMALLANGTGSPKSLALWALRAIVVDNTHLQTHFASLGVLPILAQIISDDAGILSTRTSALWTLGTLASNNVPIQDCIRTTGQLDIVVQLISCPLVQIQDQATFALYCICSRNALNQTHVGSLGAIELLTGLLPRAQARVKSSEKVLASLLCLAHKNPANQLRIADQHEGLGQIVRLLACTSPRIQGMAAGVIRTLVAEQPAIQTRLVSHGALAYLMDVCLSKDSFAQEQSVAAMYNIIATQAAINPFLAALNVHEKLFTLLTDLTKPTDLAYTCSIMILFNLAQNDQPFADLIRSRSDVMHALMRLIHPNCSSPRLRAHADRLVRLVAPILHEQRMIQCPISAIDALTPFKVPTPADPSHQILCSICLDDHAVGEDGTPSDMVFLPCIHAYHAHCIITWFQSGRDYCPYCKTSVIANVLSIAGQNLPAALRPPAIEQPLVQMDL